METLGVKNTRNWGTFTCNTFCTYNLMTMRTFLKKLSRKISKNLSTNLENNLLDLVILGALLYLIKLLRGHLKGAWNKYFTSSMYDKTERLANHWACRGALRRRLGRFFYRSDDTLHYPLIYKYRKGERYVLPDDLISGEAPTLMPYGLVVVGVLLILLIFFVMAQYILGDNVRLFTVLYLCAIISAFHFLTTQSFLVSILTFFVFVVAIFSNCVYDLGAAKLRASKRFWGYALLYGLPNAIAFIILWELAFFTKDFASFGGS